MLGRIEDVPSAEQDGRTTASNSLAKMQRRYINESMKYSEIISGNLWRPLAVVTDSYVWNGMQTYIYM